MREDIAFPGTSEFTRLRTIFREERLLSVSSVLASNTGASESFHADLIHPSAGGVYESLRLLLYEGFILASLPRVDEGLIIFGETGGKLMLRVSFVESILVFLTEAFHAEVVCPSASRVRYGSLASMSLVSTPLLGIEK